MKIKFLSAAFAIALSATVMSASAQKTINEGYASFSTELRGQPADVKNYFTADSTAAVITFGPGTVKILTTAKYDYLAVVLDIPVASLKKAGIATPSELEEGMTALPTFTFTVSGETKVISGFNCKRVVAKDNKSGKAYDVWITNDIAVPPTAIPYYYRGVGGFPVQFTSFSQGEELSVTIKSVTEGKAPAGTFAIGKDFDKGSLSDLNAQ